MKEVCLHLKKCFYELERKHLLILIGGIVFFLVLVSIAIVRNNSANYLALTQDKNKSEILLKLNQIHETLLTSARSTNSESQKNILQNLDQEVGDIKKSVLSLAKTNDLEKVSTQVLSIKTDVASQMSDIKKSILGSNGAKQYMNAEILPFKVLSVDVIAGQPYVSVDYDNRVFPLSLGDLLAGWRLVYADYNVGEAQFQNVKNQYVRVSLHGDNA